MDEATQAKNWADPSALTNIVIGIMLLLQWGIFTGKTGDFTNISIVPWLLVGIFVVFFGVILLFRQGDLVSGTINGILGFFFMGSVLFKGILMLIMFISGKSLPPEYAAATAGVDGAVFLCSAFVLLIVGYLTGGISRIFAFCNWIAAIGFLILSLVNFGIFPPEMGMVGGGCMLVIGLWLLYMGIALLLNGALGKPILSLGKPFRSK